MKKPETIVVLNVIGKKCPKGYKEAEHGIHLGKGIWLLRCEKEAKAWKK